MFSSTMLLELAQWCAPFNFNPTVFPQINFCCCQSVKFSFCPRWWFIERSCSSGVVFTFPPLTQLLDTVWVQVLIVSFFFSFCFSLFLSFLAINRIILNSASPWVWMHVDVALLFLCKDFCSPFCGFCCCGLWLLCCGLNAQKGVDTVVLFHAGQLWSSRLSYTSMLLLLVWACLTAEKIHFVCKWIFLHNFGNLSFVIYAQNKRNTKQTQNINK